MKQHLFTFVPLILAPKGTDSKRGLIPSMLRRLFRSNSKLCKVIGSCVMVEGVSAILPI